MPFHLKRTCHWFSGKEHMKYSGPVSTSAGCNYSNGGPSKYVLRMLARKRKNIKIRKFNSAVGSKAVFIFQNILNI